MFSGAKAFGQDLSGWDVQRHRARSIAYSFCDEATGAFKLPKFDLTSPGKALRKH